MSRLIDTSCSTSTMGVAGQIFTSAFQYFMTTQCLLTPYTLPEADVYDNDYFDIIVVGAGTAGSVVANRLSEIEDWHVLLIEAGDDPPVESNIPGLQHTLFNSVYDWQYLTVSDGITNQGLINGTVHWTRGKMFGGCSSINGMIYLRGNDQDYQSWYDAGNKEWSVSEVKRCFKKAENFQDMAKLTNSNISEFYGRNGPLIVNKFNSTMPTITDGILDSWDEIGIKKVTDLNVANVMGSGRVTATAANGLRQSTNRAYIMPAANRNNLKILKNAFVSKILINENKTATGVVVQWKEKVINLHANLEIILSAGPISSPQLLMLSGIGPVEHLRANNIKIKIDSPKVGQDLLDHLIVPITLYADEPNQPTECEINLDVMNYLANQPSKLAEGPLITDVVAFYSTKDNATYPDSQIHFGIFPKNTSNLSESFMSLFGYNEKISTNLATLNKDHSFFYFLYNLLHPYSKGNISLQSNDPNDPPLIYPNYFQDPRDLETAVKAIRTTTKIVNSTFFKSINGFLGRMDIPECDDLELDSEDYWRCICKNIVTTIYHPVGTCKMGSDINTSVVDSRLKVHGVSHLRVIDSSVMPGQISSNTNAATVMIGERGSELIKQDHNKINPIVL